MSIAVIAIAVNILVLLVIALQMRTQNRQLRAQLHRDWFETYWKLLEPTTEEQIKELELTPEDWMSEARYESEYKNDHNKIRKYLGSYREYECLGMSYERLRDLPVPRLEEGIKMWAGSLVTQKTFLDAHEFLKGYYSDLAKVVTQLIQ